MYTIFYLYFALYIMSAFIAIWLGSGGVKNNMFYRVTHVYTCVYTHWIILIEEGDEKSVIIVERVHNFA